MWRKTHRSWFIAWLCLGFLVGDALCLVYGYVNTPFIWITFVCACLVLMFPYRVLLPTIIIVGMFMGFWRGCHLLSNLAAYNEFYGVAVTLKGTVAEDVSYDEKGGQRYYLKNINIGSARLGGKVWVSANKKDIKRGDIVTVKGVLEKGFGNVSAVIYRATVNEIIRVHPGDIARQVRDWFAHGIRRAIPEPQVSLGLGYLLGQKTALPEDLEQQIKATGLTHVVVASGYNLTILVLFSRQLFMRISKFTATVASSLMVFSFMMVTGFSPSMSRAGLVAFLSLLVWYYGRKMHPFILLSFAAAVTVMIEPSYLWGDLGWYLSFLSFIGVIVLAPLVHQYFWPNKEPSAFRQLTVDTLAAQFITTPIILGSFGIFAVFALPANAMVLPLVPLAMLCTFLAGIVGILLPALAVIAGFPAYLILKYSTSVIQFWAELPNSQFELKINSSLIIASYIFIGALIIYLKRRTQYDFRNPTSSSEHF